MKYKTLKEKFEASQQENSNLQKELKVKIEAIRVLEQQITDEKN